MDTEDVRLMEMFESNREDAFRELFVRYYKPMVLAARIYSNNNPEAEDMVQQFFVKFWEEKLYRKINTSFKHYLRISVRNTCFNHLNRLMIRQQHEPDSDLESEVEQAIDFILRKEELEIFEKAYDELPPQSRKVFELVYFSDRSYNEAAQMLDLSINTVKSHLKTAVRILKNSTLLNNYYCDRKKS
ncbi:MAG: RNA polymerase sigma-70 factor [Bacteroidales bacterium]|nr:RNA polymerase sigma-70 factor [Bacteroidales bacterium]